MPGQGIGSFQPALPKGIWLSFDFDDSHPVCNYVTLTFACLYNQFPLNFFISHLLIFFSSSQDLPALYLQGGSIIPFGPPHQHVGEASLFDDLSLIVALDEHGIDKSN